MAEANVINIHKLPPEVLAKIFEHCGLNELVNIVDVCQLWRDVAVYQYNTSVKDLEIRQPEDINKLVTLLCKPVRFTRLHVVWDVPVDIDCRSVYGSLDGLIWVTSVTHLVSFAFKLKDKNLHYQGDYDYVVVLAWLLSLLQRCSTDTLTHLKLINTGSLIRLVVLELIQSCQQLSHLVLNHSNLHRSDQQTYEDVIPTLAHLKLLDLRHTTGLLPFNVSLIAAIVRGCPNISNNIMIDWLKVRPSDDVRIMVQFVSFVRRLYLDGFNTGQLKSLISCLKECVSKPTVDWLWVHNSKDHITDNILLSLAQCLRGLTMIYALGCDRLTNKGVANLIRSIPALEGIDISHIQNIDRDIIELLGPVVTKQNVLIHAHDTQLSEQLVDKPDIQLYTGKNKNICLKYRWY